MKHYLIRKETLGWSITLTIAEFDDQSEALDARFAMERVSAGPHVEIVLVSAPSYEALQSTHLRLTTESFAEMEEHAPDRPERPRAATG